MGDLVSTPPSLRNECALMRRWLVKVKSKRGLALRDVFIVAKDELSARHRVQQMYLLSEIETICPSNTDALTAATLITKR